MNCKVVLIWMVLIFHSLQANEFSANPDHISTGFEFFDLPEAKVGYSKQIQALFAGAMIEVRNEKRFNSFLLPNHNWRGILVLNGKKSLLKTSALEMKLKSGLKHESAHPTMGIRDTTSRAYDMVYDDVYRRYILNSGFTGLILSKDFHPEVKFQQLFQVDLYLQSKNTPELSSSTLASTPGFSLGSQLDWAANKSMNLSLAMYYRFINQSRQNSSGMVYFQRNIIYLNRNENCGNRYIYCGTVNYPVIRKSHTLVLETSVGWNFPDLNLTPTLFFNLLHGNPYGFIDSREKRTRFTMGIEI